MVYNLNNILDLTQQAEINGKRMELILQNDLGSRLNKDEKTMVTLNKLLKEND